jgi:hypothetical protein
MWKSLLVGLLVVSGWGMLTRVPIGTAAENGEYLPLAVGNRWVYQSSEGTETDPVLESWEVVRQEGAAFVVQVQQPFVTTGGLEELFEMTIDGVRVREQDAAASEFQLVLKTQPQAGMSWQSGAVQYAFTAVGETVTVPAGTFTNCVEVTRWKKEPKITIVTTYAPGVGMIQREETFPIIGGFGSGTDFQAPARGHTVLQLKTWEVKK